MIRKETNSQRNSTKKFKKTNLDLKIRILIKEVIGTTNLKVVIENLKEEITNLKEVVKIRMESLSFRKINLTLIKDQQELSL